MKFPLTPAVFLVILLVSLITTNVLGSYYTESLPLEELEKVVLSRSEIAMIAQKYISQTRERCYSILSKNSESIFAREKLNLYERVSAGEPRVIFSPDSPLFYWVPLKIENFICGFLVFDAVKGEIRSSPCWKEDGEPLFQLEERIWNNLEEISANAAGIRDYSQARLIFTMVANMPLLYVAFPSQSDIQRVDVTDIGTGAKNGVNPVLMLESPDEMNAWMPPSVCTVVSENPGPVPERSNISIPSHFELSCLPWVRDQGAFGTCMANAGAAELDWWQCGNLCFNGEGNSSLYSCICPPLKGGRCRCFYAPTSRQYLYDRARMNVNQDCRVSCPGSCEGSEAGCKESLVTSGKQCGVGKCGCEGSYDWKIAKVMTDNGSCNENACAPYGCDGGCTDGARNPCEGTCVKCGDSPCGDDFKLLKYWGIPMDSLYLTMEKLYTMGMEMEASDVCNCWFGGGGCLCMPLCECSGAGGHGYVYYGYDRDDSVFYLQNSWGSWNSTGRGEVSFGFHVAKGSATYVFRGYKPKTAHIYYKSHDLDDPTGNNDGRPDPGETIELKLEIMNIGASIDSVKVSARSDDPGNITFTSNKSDYGSLAHLEIKNNESSPFIFEVSQSATPHFAKFYFDITGSGGYTGTDSLKLLICRPPLLLLDDDGGNDLEKYFQPLLTDLLGDVYDYWDEDSLSSVTSDELQKYNVVIWFTGEEKKALGADTTAIKTFLDSGKCLFLTGQNIGNELKGTNFYKNYLHAELYRDNCKNPLITGVFGDPIGAGDTLLTMGGEGANNCSSPSEITPLSPAVKAFGYYGSNYAAMLHFKDKYSLVYCATNFEGISTLKDRENVLKRIFSFFSFPYEVMLHEFTISEAANSLYLNWEVQSGQGFQGVHVYRALAQGNSSYERLTQNPVKESGFKGSFRDLNLTPNTSYKYQLGILFNNMEFRSGEMSVHFSGKVPGNFKFELNQNYPNPFNPLTSISFQVPGNAEEQVSTILSIYDINGRLIKTLVNGQRNAGRYSVIFNGKNEKGSDVASGVYFYRLVCGEIQEIRKMILVK